MVGGSSTYQNNFDTVGGRHGLYRYCYNDQSGIHLEHHLSVIIKYLCVKI